MSSATLVHFSRQSRSKSESAEYEVISLVYTNQHFVEMNNQIRFSMTAQLIVEMFIALLTLDQATNVRLFQIERASRKQF